MTHIRETTLLTRDLELGDEVALRRVQTAFRLARGRISGRGGVASRLGVGPRTVRRWLNGDEGKPIIAAVRKIADACGYVRGGGNPEIETLRSRSLGRKGKSK